MREYVHGVGVLLVVMAVVACMLSYASISFESVEVRQFWNGGVRLRGGNVTATTTPLPFEPTQTTHSSAQSSSTGSPASSSSSAPPSSSTATTSATATTTSAGAASSTAAPSAPETSTAKTSTAAATTAISTNVDLLPEAVCGRRVDRSSAISTSELGRDCSGLRKVIVLGNDSPFGRTNNRLLTIFHAFDKAWEENAILASSGWAAEALAAFDTSAFNRILCAKTYADLTTAEKSGAEEVNSQPMYYLNSGLAERRKQMLALLFSYPRADRCDGIRDFVSRFEMFTVVHSRHLEGECEERMEELAQAMGADAVPLEGCTMSPAYIKGILRPLGMIGKPLVFIGDGQQPAVLEALQSDPELGSSVHRVPEGVTSVENDMLIGTLSNVFIGVGVSTMAGNVARARVALGFAENTNFVFLREDTSPTTAPVAGEKAWKPCAECLWDGSKLRQYHFRRLKQSKQSSVWA